MKVMVTHLNKENTPLNFIEAEGDEGTQLEMKINKAIRHLLDDCLFEPGDSITIKPINEKVEAVYSGQWLQEYINRYSDEEDDDFYEGKYLR